MQLDELLTGNELAWSRLVCFAERTAHFEARRSRLTPSEADEIRGALIVLVLRDDMKVLRRLRLADCLASYLKRSARRLGSRIRTRHASRRPVLDSHMSRQERQGSFLENWIDAAPTRPMAAAQPACPELFRRFLAASLQSLTPAQGEVLWRRYVGRWSWTRIGASLARTRNATRRLHDRAVASLSRRYKRRSARAGVEGRAPVQENWLRARKI